jgi:uncharacterized membrane protein YgcG
MLKFLVLVLIVIGVIVFLTLRRTPKRPPRDWRRGSDDPGPVLPGSVIGHDAGRKSFDDKPSGDGHEKVTGDTVSADGDGGGGDGGGGGGD